MNEPIKQQNARSESKKWNKKTRKTIFFLTVLSMLGMVTMPLAAHAEERVNIYSFRQPFLIEPILKVFEKKTKIKTHVVSANNGITQRMKSEGKNSPVDVVLTVDISTLHEMMKANLSQRVDSDVLNKAIPQHLRGAKNHWFALTQRARVLYVSKERVKEGEIKNYEDLADKKWQGRICTRSGYHKYNIALFASFLKANGKKRTKDWLKKLKKNLARKPQGNDRTQSKAIRDGLCDVALGNSYYYGKMLENKKEPEQKKWAKAIRLLFPNQKNRGTHVNVSGMILAKYSPNKKNALKLMEFLASKEAQEIYANTNYEFPVNPKVPKSQKIPQLNQDFVAEKTPLSEIAKLNKDVIVLLNEIKFDH